jgi:ATP-dependent helicase/nuclease subunit B
MARFIGAIGKDWPEDALDHLLAIGEEVFKPFEREERVQTFWKPVFEKVARWFVEMEQERWPDIQQAFTEKGARKEMLLPDGQVFALTGQIDRIDLIEGGTLRIADYKTGAAPSAKQVGKGNEPQLTLSAALAAHGAVKGVPPSSVSGLEYITLGREPECKVIELDQPIDQVAAHHLEQLKTVLVRLRKGEAGYLSRRMPFKQNESGDYDHLARAAEWSQTAEEE